MNFTADNEKGFTMSNCRKLTALIFFTITTCVVCILIAGCQSREASSSQTNTQLNSSVPDKVVTKNLTKPTSIKPVKENKYGNDETLHEQSKYAEKQQTEQEENQNYECIDIQEPDSPTYEIDGIASSQNVQQHIQSSMEEDPRTDDDMITSPKPSNISEPIQDDIVYIKAHTEIEYPNLVYSGKPFIIDNEEDFKVLLQGIPSTYDGYGNPVAPACSVYGSDNQLLSDAYNTTILSDTFTESFFNTHYLVCASYAASSGSDVVFLEELSRTDDGYIATFGKNDRDGMLGTCDMAYWTALVPMRR